MQELLLLRARQCFEEAERRLQTVAGNLFLLEIRIRDPGIELHDRLSGLHLLARFGEDLRHASLDGGRQRSGLMEQRFAGTQSPNHLGHGPQFGSLHAHGDRLQYRLVLLVAGRVAASPATACNREQHTDVQNHRAICNGTTRWPSCEPAQRVPGPKWQ